eukprot:scaffold402762_cov75-Attheya_sp.AAC.2
MAYAGIQKSLQQEWKFVQQRVIDGIGEEFSKVKAALMEVFLPALFGETTPIGSHLQTVAALPVKVSELSIPKATHSATKIFLFDSMQSWDGQLVESCGSLASDTQASLGIRSCPTDCDSGCGDHQGHTHGRNF